MCILERGRRWDPKDYPRKPTDAWVWDQRHPERHNGWFDLRLFKNMAVGQAAGVGGGSLCHINAIETPPADAFGPWPSEITLDENQCLSCHDVNTYKQKNAPKIGDSHFKDARGKMQKTVSSARYNCQQCHVPQVDAPPLVENMFRGAPPAAPGTKGK